MTTGSRISQFTVTITVIFAKAYFETWDILTCWHWVRDYAIPPGHNINFESTVYYRIFSHSFALTIETSWSRFCIAWLYITVLQYRIIEKQSLSYGSLQYSGSPDYFHFTVQRYCRYYAMAWGRDDGQSCNGRLQWQVYKNWRQPFFLRWLAALQNKYTTDSNMLRIIIHCVLYGWQSHKIRIQQTYAAYRNMQRIEICSV